VQHSSDFIETDTRHGFVVGIATGVAAGAVVGAGLFAVLFDATLRTMLLGAGMGALMGAILGVILSGVVGAGLTDRRLQRLASGLHANEWSSRSRRQTRLGENRVAHVVTARGGRFEEKSVGVLHPRGSDGTAHRRAENRAARAPSGSRSFFSACSGSTVASRRAIALISRTDATIRSRVTRLAHCYRTTRGDPHVARRSPCYDDRFGYALAAVAEPTH
jgi:hypothetical protein